MRSPANDDSTTADTQDGAETTYIDTQLDGLWVLHDFECPQGAQLQGHAKTFKEKPDLFAQFLFSTDELTLRGKEYSTGCIVEGRIKIEIIEDYIYSRQFLGGVEKCPGKPDKFQSTHNEPAPFKIRTLESGEHELLIESDGFCTNRTKGNIILRRAPIG